MIGFGVVAAAATAAPTSPWGDGSAACGEGAGQGCEEYARWGGGGRHRECIRRWWRAGALDAHAALDHPSHHSQLPTILVLLCVHIASPPIWQPRAWEGRCEHALAPARIAYGGGCPRAHLLAL